MLAQKMQIRAGITELGTQSHHLVIKSDMNRGIVGVETWWGCYRPLPHLPIRTLFFLYFSFFSLLFFSLCLLLPFLKWNHKGLCRSRKRRHHRNTIFVGYRIIPFNQQTHRGEYWVGSDNCSQRGSSWRLGFRTETFSCVHPLFIFFFFFFQFKGIP